MSPRVAPLGTLLRDEVLWYHETAKQPIADREPLYRVRSKALLAAYALASSQERTDAKLAAQVQLSQYEKPDEVPELFFRLGVVCTLVYGSAAGW